MFIGNDIIDLKEPLHPRFRDKVCSDNEIAALNKSNENPWLFWAIKESSFKAFKKIDSTVNFIPKRFIVSSNPWQCQLGLLKADIQVIQTNQYIHAIAICTQEKKFQVLSEVSTTKQVGWESEEVRSLGINMLEALGYKNCYVANKPPQVIQFDTIVHDVDITLSHDGRFIAAALLI